MTVEEMYNRICNLVFLEEVRLYNRVVELENMIAKTNSHDPRWFIELAQAKAVKNYFSYWSASFLNWLQGFL